ncbi:MAG TPA: NAD(P)/FAD-dependent oxidoreductase [Candidatus Limnocylindria bacterium]|nr:NAD(P)/FAD-dependent oxidoreductase [Candidatus Limnocylindria bacterium]
MEPRHVDALLIGGGVAAARCARGLRRAGFSGSVVLVGDEGLPPYNRPPLSKELLRDALPDDLLLAEPLAWYERRGVELLLGSRVVSLDPVARLAELDGGTRLRYGACLLATGAEPRALDVPGGERARLLRTVADARAIRDAAEPGASAVVVGGGFIGVEASAALAERKVAVTLLCASDQLWGGAFGAAVSAWATERLRTVGVHVRFGAAITSLDGVAAELVVAGVGVQPRVELAVSAGLEVDDGVVVDGSQQTSIPRLYAAGDVARTGNRPRVEHWHAARDSGERAGLAIAGAPLPPTRAPWIFSEFAGAKLDAVGWAAPGAPEVDVLPGVIGYLVGDRVGQLAILDGAVDVAAARLLVDRHLLPRSVRGALEAE